ncbi:MAG: DUF4621 domain-containing protein [Bacteroidales bacterium]|nr:DUF4621 domain-containing protein [Bacteroidales bacterium]
MRQRPRFLKNIGIVFAIFSIFVVIPSCIDELYNLNNGLSSKMVLGGDSLSIPIGSTDTIKLSDILKDYDIEMLKTMEDGGYGLSMKDSIDVDIPKIDQTALAVSDKTLSKNKPISFGDISLADFKIPGKNVSNEFGLSLSSVSINNFKIPALSQDTSFGVGMSQYKLQDLTVDPINVEASKDHIFAGVNLPPIPPVGTAELTIKDTSINVNTSASFTNTIDVPNNVTGIDTIKLKSGATFQVSIALEGATGLFSTNETSIVPNLTIEPSSLFLFAGGGGHPVHLNTGSLNSTNNFSQSTPLYSIEAFKIEPGELGNGQINISRDIQVGGSMALNSAKIMSDRVDDLNNLKLAVNVSVNGIVIKSMKFNIPPIVTDLTGERYFGVNNSVPSEIDSIKVINLVEDPAKISFELKAPNLPDMENGEIKIDELAITFPKELKLKANPNVNGQVYTLNNLSFTPEDGYKADIYLDHLDLSDRKITDSQLNLNGFIRYTGNMSLKGRIDSEVLGATQDASMGVKLDASLSFKSATVVTKDISKNVNESDSIGIALDIDIADQVKRLNTVTITPGTKIQIKIDPPDLPLALTGNNLRINFPDLFKFKSDIPTLQPGMGNYYLINGSIPSTIELELEALNINQDLENGVLKLDKSIKLSGGVKLLAGEVSSTAIDELSGKNLKIEAIVPDLTIASTPIEFKTLDANYTDSTNLDIVIDPLPKEIVSLDSVILDDNAYLDINIDITDMPDLSSPLMANINLDFPQLINFAPNTVDANNRLTINQAFTVDQTLNKASLHKRVKINGFKFSNEDLNGKLEIHKKVKFDVGVSVVNPTVNSAELTSNTINANVDVILSGINFKEVYGNFNPGIAPINENVSLSDLPDFMKKDDVVLDITRPVIVLETQSNLEIPIDATMTLTPKKNGTEITSSRITLPVLNFPKAKSSSEPDTARFWIGPLEEGKPENYQFKRADIQNMFKTVPDDITFVVDAQANTEEKHHIDLNAEYKMNIKYDVRVPMAFGDELNIEIRDTISDLDESIGDLAFSGKSLEIFGDVLNSIPLQLDFTMYPLDKDNNYIAVDSVSQVIKSGAFDGSAVSSKISLKFEDPDGLMKDVRGFELVFKACTNGTPAGTAIKPENYIKADLKVRLKGGINIGDK